MKFGSQSDEKKNRVRRLGCIRGTNDEDRKWMNNNKQTNKQKSPGHHL